MDHRSRSRATRSRRCSPRPSPSWNRERRRRRSSVVVASNGWFARRECDSSVYWYPIGSKNVKLFSAPSDVFTDTYFPPPARLSRFRSAPQPFSCSRRYEAGDGGHTREDSRSQVSCQHRAYHGGATFVSSCNCANTADYSHVDSAWRDTCSPPFSVTLFLL